MDANKIPSHIVNVIAYSISDIVASYFEHPQHQREFEEWQLHRNKLILMPDKEEAPGGMGIPQGAK